MVLTVPCWWPFLKCVIWSTMTVLNMWTKAKHLCIFHLPSKRQDSLSPQKYAHHMMTSLDLLYNEVKCYYPLITKLVTWKPSAHTLHALRLAGSQGDCQHPEDLWNWGSAADQKRQYCVQHIAKVVTSVFSQCHTNSIYYLHSVGLIKNNLEHLILESFAKVISWFFCIIFSPQLSLLLLYITRGQLPGTEWNKTDQSGYAGQQIGINESVMCDQYSLIPQPRWFDTRRHKLYNNFHLFHPKSGFVTSRLFRANSWPHMCKMIWLALFVNLQGACAFGDSLRSDPIRLRLKKWCTAVAMTAERTLPRLCSPFSRTLPSRWVLYVPRCPALMQRFTSCTVPGAQTLMTVFLPGEQTWRHLLLRGLFPFLRAGTRCHGCSSVE